MADKVRKQKAAESDENEESKPRARGRARAGGKTSEKERLADTAKRFKALGEPTRLKIILFLKGQWEAEQAAIAEGVRVNGIEGTEAKVVVPHRGARITEICHQVNGGEKITSTFSHHIKELRRVGLIRVERDGKNRWCQIEPETVESLHLFLGLSAQDKTPSIPRDPATGANGIEGATD